MLIYRDDIRKIVKVLVEIIKNIEIGFLMVVFFEGGCKNCD